VGDVFAYCGDRFSGEAFEYIPLVAGQDDALATGAAERGEARIVALTSGAHLYSPVVFDEIHFTRRAYAPQLAYGQSKTANSLFNGIRWRVRRPVPTLAARRSLGPDPGHVADTGRIGSARGPPATAVPTAIRSFKNGGCPTWYRVEGRVEGRCTEGSVMWVERADEQSPPPVDRSTLLALARTGRGPRRGCCLHFHYSHGPCDSRVDGAGVLSEGVNLA
jgi:hypothetical protein